MVDEDPPLLEIGRVGRAHGLAGEVSVQLSTNVEGRLAPGTSLVVGDEQMVVVTSRPHQQRWLVKFDGCTDRGAAERLRGRSVSAPAAADPDDPDALFVHQLIGATVIDSTGRAVGTVVEVIENPAADLLSLDGGALLPLNFVAEVADGTVVLVDDVPDGLFDV